MNKQEILEKLWNDRELSTDEIMYISMNLQDGIEPLGFDHEAPSNLEACKISEKDAIEFNRVFSAAFDDTPDKLPRTSELIQKMESFTSNPKYLRLIVIQALMYAQEYRSRGGLLGL